MEEQLQDKIKYIRINLDESNATKILDSLSDDEKEIILHDITIQNIILNFDNVNTLKNIFRKSPIYFQEILFENIRIQNLLLTINNKISKEDILSSKENLFTAKEIRKMEVFVRNIKSSKVFNELIKNETFKYFIINCNYNSLKKSFFDNINKEQLFYNIVNSSTYTNLNINRKLSLITLFNTISDHLLLPFNYNIVFKSSVDIIKLKEICTFEKINIDKNTLSILSSKMIDELIKLHNIDNKIIIDFLCNDIIESIEKLNYNFKKIFYHLIDNSSEFTNIDLMYFNKIIERSKTDNEQIKSMLYITITNYDISKTDYIQLFKKANIVKTLFYIKFKNIPTIETDLETIDENQLLSINTKAVNTIASKINTNLINRDNSIYILAIKMYLTFGLELSLNILDNKFGTLDELFFINLNKLNTINVKFKQEGKKYLPIINKEFINFMFSNKNNNNFIDMFIQKNYLKDNWSYLYNNFSKIKEKCRNEITIKKVNIILKQTSPNRSITDISPNNFRLGEDDILDDVCIGNRSEKKPSEIYSILLEIYEKMKLRIESSIPYVKGYTNSGYRYECMKLTDPIAFTLGFKANSCIRLEDIAHNHLLHATLCRNGRIILIYDYLNRLVAFSPIKRNGEVLIVNSIECTFDYSDEYILEAFNESIDAIISKTHENINEDTPINLVCIGKDSHVKPEYTPLPPKVSTPNIYEKNEPLYRNTDEYHKTLYIIRQTSNLDIYNIRYGNPKASYMDPREIIRHCDFKLCCDKLINKALKRINSIRYTNTEISKLDDFKLATKDMISKCIFNEDWYVLIDNNGNIFGEYIDIDPRAKIEYLTTLEELCNEYTKEKQYFKTYSI